MKLLQILVLLFFSHIVYAQSNINNLNYSNLIIISDLSSRTRSPKFPLKDIEKINELIKYFRDECVKPGQKLGDKSCLSYHTFTKTPPFVIDISRFSNIGERQKFINSTAEYKNCGLHHMLEELKKHIANVYSHENNNGLDLISFLIEKIENNIDIKVNSTQNKEGQKISINYDNHIYLFTDGYLEYRNQHNLEYYFGENQIKNLRKYCIDFKINVPTALAKNSSLGLPKSYSLKNSKINLHILETHERDKNTQFLTYNNPSGLRDNEILEAVWRKWANESGFKSFEWKKY